MKDDLTVLLIDSVNQNRNLDATQKLELVEYTIRNCKEKKIGKIVMDAITKQSTKKRGRGRPKKERTENEKNMIKIAQENRSL